MAAAATEETVFGVSGFHHDAAVAAVRGEEILFAAHAERYSRRKNDPELSQELVDDAVAVAGPPDRIVFYERPLLTHLRRVMSGQLRDIVAEPWPLRRLRGLKGLERAPIHCVGHHLAHACGGYFTSPFEEAAIIVADGIGELDTLTVWHARGRRLRRVLTVRYPHSLGLLYSAFTRRVGLKPNEEEFILMALAALGSPRYRDLIREDFLRPVAPPRFRLRRPVHAGVDDWRLDLRDRQNIAASVQAVAEEYMLALVAWTMGKTGSRNLVCSGGVALNCVLNDRIARLPEVERVWILPNPGDAGSSLGAALAYLGRPVRWRGPYLGHEIRREVALSDAVQALVAGKVVAVASGRAEFGPRALGNRSLLADPRPRGMKDRVNEIKRREPFRPFAPVVQSEHAASRFDLPVAEAPYMQFAVPCREPQELPAVCHVDGTSRVQTVTREQNPHLHAILDGFRRETGCPVLLNTSLNIKGQPLVNTWDHARQFSELHDVVLA